MHDVYQIPVLEEYNDIFLCANNQPRLDMPGDDQEQPCRLITLDAQLHHLLQYVHADPHARDRPKKQKRSCRASESRNERKTSCRIPTQVLQSSCDDVTPAHCISEMKAISITNDLMQVESIQNETSIMNSATSNSSGETTKRSDKTKHTDPVSNHTSISSSHLNEASEGNSDRIEDNLKLESIDSSGRDDSTLDDCCPDTEHKNSR